MPIGPIGEGGVRGCKLGLKLRKHQDNADRDHQRDRNVAKYIGVEAKRIPDGSHEHANGYKRN